MVLVMIGYPANNIQLYQLHEKGSKLGLNGSNPNRKALGCHLTNINLDINKGIIPFPSPPLPLP